tara:strand:+ start:154953 stop:155519 length:567 start_codon:yes stop_codon:yes gene_type:complete
MVDTSGLQEKIQKSAEKSLEFEKIRRLSFYNARIFGVLGAFLLAVDLALLQFHDEEAYLKLEADYAAGQLVIPEDYLVQKTIDCFEEVYEDQFEEDMGVDFDELSASQATELGKNQEAFARCAANVLAQSDDIQKDYVSSQGFHWNPALFVWGGIGGLYALGGLSSWNRQRKYGNEAKSKAEELKLFD